MISPFRTVVHLFLLPTHLFLHSSGIPFAAPPSSIFKVVPIVKEKSLAGVKQRYLADSVADQSPLMRDDAAFGSGIVEGEKLSLIVR